MSEIMRLSINMADIESRKRSRPDETVPQVYGAQAAASNVAHLPSL